MTFRLQVLAGTSPFFFKKKSLEKPKVMLFRCKRSHAVPEEEFGGLEGIQCWTRGNCLFTSQVSSPFQRQWQLVPVQLQNQ